MIVYHVIGASKLRRCICNGYIPAPVRAWKDIRSAERFSIQTGRPIILRLSFPDDAKVLEGHRGKAVYIDTNYSLDSIFGKTFNR